MRGCVTKLVIPLVLVGLFSYLVLPGLVEDQIAQRLQESTGALTRPEVEVSSSFPPEMLLGRIDRVQVSMDQMSLQGRRRLLRRPGGPGGRECLGAK
ncbi:MAG: DUF2993 domain-containing protein, partial [Actinomycetota bacterium]|nr:DUF2993 domain-containing protein [Actinomycetota bacterium]